MDSTIAEEVALDADIARWSLSPADANAFVEAEDVIREGLKTFFDVGTALAAVRDNRWYRAKGYASFEAYCMGEWQFTDRRARQFIDAADAVLVLSAASDEGETGTIVPVSLPSAEAQARPLTRVDASDIPAVWQDANQKAKAEGKPVAARHVEAAAGEQRSRTAVTPPRAAPTLPAAPIVIWHGPIYRAFHYTTDADGNDDVQIVEVEAVAQGGNAYVVKVEGLIVSRVGGGLEAAKTAAAELITRGTLPDGQDGGE